MTFASELKNSFEGILKYGDLIRLKYYNIALVGSYYDDDTALTQSGGDLWTSGLVQPLDTRSGSKDSLLLQQGKITIDDKKVYVDGSIQTSGLGPIKLGVGSPTPQENEILNNGQVIEWQLNGSPIYKKIYCRYLTGGSFVGES